MSRRLLLPLTVLLATVSAGVLAGAAVAIPAPAASSDQSMATDALVRHFYSAVNRTLTTGDPATLTALLASATAPSPPPVGAEAGITGLPERLIALHAVQPSLRIVVEEVIADSDTAVAWVSFLGQDPGTIAIVPAAPGSERVLDGFGTRDGRIVALWGATASLAAPTILAEAEVRAPSDETAMVSVSRLTLPPGSEIPTMMSAGPLILMTEGGILHVSGNAIKQPILSLSKNVSVVRPVATGEELSMTPPDQAVVMAGSPFSLRNDSTEPAVALILALQPPSQVGPDGSGTRGDAVPAQASSAVVLVDHGNWERSWSRGIDGRRIVQGELPVNAGGWVRITVARAMLQPGSELRGSAEHPLLLAAEGGPLVAFRATGGGTHAAAVGPGEPLTVGDGDVVRLQGAGDKPVGTLLLSVQPIPHDPASRR